MTVEAIINRIHIDTDEEIRIITAEEEEDVHSLKDQADQRAEEAYQHRIREGQRELRQYIASQQSRTRIDAKRMVRETKDHMIQACLSQTQEFLKTIRTRSEYPTILERLLSECFESLGTRELLISVHPNDRSLVTELISTLVSDKKTIHLSDTPIATNGGIICERISDQVMIDNTVEGRFSRLHRDLIVAASQELFQPGDT